MILRGVDFGRVWGASGVQGFFGEGYWFHRLPFGPDFTDVTFVAKTTTFNARQGNMELGPDYVPKELFPDCITVNFLQGRALNSVGLSGPGAYKLFAAGKWQIRTRPFVISFMAVASSRAEREKELIGFVKLFSRFQPDFKAPVAAQINYSCPNTGLHVDELVAEVAGGLDIASRLGVPLIPKFNVMLPPEVAVRISEHEHCDALCITNAIPFGQMADEIDWKRMYPNGSPIAKYGGGALSGRHLLPLLVSWITEVKKAGLAKPLNAGGGILSRADAEAVWGAGAESIFLGSIAFLRPWRIQGIVRDQNSR